MGASNRNTTHLGWFDLTQKELRQAVIQNLGSDPGSPVNGQAWYLTTTHRLRVRANGATQYLLTDQDITTLRDFSLSTGTRTSTAISDFAEAAQDAAGAALAAGTHTGATVTYSATQDTANRIDIAVTDSPLLGGQTLAQVRARSSHTGTQTASTISDFDTAVRLNRLDQMGAPTASVSMNSQKIINGAAGTAPADFVIFSQLEAVRQGIRAKPSVEAAPTTNVTIANPGTNVFDGVTVAVGERVLLPAQTTDSEKGIYVFNGNAVAMTRADDADTFAELDSGTRVFVQGGNGTNALKEMQQLTELTSFTGQVWSAVGAGTSYVAGDGLTESPAGTFNVGAGNGVTVTANAVALDPAVACRKVLALVGDGAALNINILHNLGNQWVNVDAWEAGSPFGRIDVDAEATDANNVVLKFAVAPALNSVRVIVMG